MSDGMGVRMNGVGQFVLMPPETNIVPSETMGEAILGKPVADLLAEHRQNTDDIAALKAAAAAVKAMPRMDARDPVNSPSLKVQRALAARPRTLRTERVVLAIVLVLGTASAFLVTGAALLRRFFLPALLLGLAVGCAALKADAVALKGDLHAGATVAVGLGEEVVAEAAANPEVVTELATVGADLAQRAGDPTVAADLTAAITPQNVAVQGPKFVAAAKKVQGATAPSAAK